MHIFLSRLNEAQRRWYVGLLSQKAGSPSDVVLSQITGLDGKTIRRGRQEIRTGLSGLPPDRQRRRGGGRPRAEKKDPELVNTLMAVVEPQTAGDPMGQRGKWLNCRLADIVQTLKTLGKRVSQPVISRLLKARDYRLHVHVKHHNGTDHPERDSQFAYIAQQRTLHQAAGQPTISVDTKKKELVGNFKNAGRIWGQHPEIVNVHDFPQDAVGRAVPYGVYDLQHNCGTVYVGQSGDTAAFAVDNLVQWCQTEMPQRFPKATTLFIEADGGGSNNSRSRLWKQQLQEKIADGLGVTVTVCHYPPGTSKWNPIEHRLFSEISKTWAGCPLHSFDLILGYIRDTKTSTGLTIQAHLITQTYPIGVKVSDEVMHTLNIKPHDQHPQWNYTIRPRCPS